MVGHYRQVVAKTSAGLLLFRRNGNLEVLLVHPGGPLWAKKDEGAWSIPKGEIEPGEDPLAAARREFEEELGSPVTGEFIALAPIRQASGKLVHAWAVEGDFDPATLTGGTFSMEWPPRSGRQQQFPEVDRAEWFTIDDAKRKINKAQTALLDELSSLSAARFDRRRRRPPARAEDPV
jgi:predicted NUDIX family NTP pyrophosphohydrolase